MIKPAFYIALFFISFAVRLQAQQNLVINGDFEQMSSCPEWESMPSQNPKEIEKCIGWKAPTFGTSDYFNTCATNPTISAPVNGLGEQSPFNGDGYLGGFATAYGGGAGDDGYAGIMWWEYIQGKLIAPLEQGKIYKFSMEVSLAEYSDLLITELAVHFSDTPLSSPNTAALTVTPQCVFYDPNYFHDTANWVHVESYYVASGGEQYITIGNFRDDLSTDTLRRYDLSPLGLLNPYTTYFYYDHVVLTEDSMVEISNVFTPNGDGINDVWQVPFGSSGETTVIYILNRWGNIVFQSSLNGFTWEGKTLGGDSCSDGVYFYRISNTNIAGFIQLVR